MSHNIITDLQESQQQEGVEILEGNNVIKVTIYPVIIAEDNELDGKEFIAAQMNRTYNSPSAINPDEFVTMQWSLDKKNKKRSYIMKNEIVKKW